MNDGDELTLETLADAEDLWDDYHNGDGPPFMAALQAQKVRAMAAVVAVRTSRSLAEALKLPFDEISRLSGSTDPKEDGAPTTVAPPSSPETGS